MYYGSRAIILKSLDYQDADKLVTIFSEREGKIRAVAKGVKKPKSSLRAVLQPFTHSFLYLSRGRDLDLITQGRLLDFYPRIREDLGSTLYTAYIMELLDKSLVERAPLGPLYNETLQVLNYINDKGAKSLVIRYFEIRLIQELGYRPVLEACAACGQKNLTTRFNLAEGGVLCHDCAGFLKTDFMLSGEAFSLLKFLQRADWKSLDRIKASSEALSSLEQLLEKYLEYHLESRFSLKNTIYQLKKSLPGAFDKG
ncbi:DNA replication and repair protein RecO [Thermosyntropha lipolytica DSM 11003]|uniref:DNA repair protein RecO n=1 Tax=Thermosyntropha lipolytica DSM 11003 TaxID=1123382 RepID=A0A1M5N9R0_9FIRM|nr:DNA repair protein RecO [Thermosyntropha lipolytica]SHG86182.1 DNA replication and repair protein RecO [Thermosyntropha lipolytica DSM 11003]